MRNVLHFARTGQGKGISAGYRLYELGKRSLWIYKHGIRPAPQFYQEMKNQPGVVEKKGKLYGIKRLICPNYHLDKNHDWFKKYGQFYHFWDDPRELIKLRHCDIIIDEIGSLFPCDDWKNTPKAVRKVFTHFRKRGIEIFGFTQDYGMVDINYRRVVNVAYQSFKFLGSPDISATLPEVKHPWGLVFLYKLDIESLHRDADIVPIEKFPKIRFIRKKYTNMYDTTEEINVLSDNKLRHTVKFCENYGQPDDHGEICTFKKVVHEC